MVEVRYIVKVKDIYPLISGWNKFENQNKVHLRKCVCVCKYIYVYIKQR